MDIEGRTAMVTGAGAGIGRTIALRLAAKKAAVVVVDVDGVAARRTVEAVADAGGRASAVVADLTRPRDVERVVATATAADGRLDILVNNAGGYASPVYPEASARHWQRVLDLNLRAPMLAIQAALPALERDGGGAVVNIASSAGVGLDPHPGPEYAAAKAGVIRLTACLGPLGERGVRVNCVCPHTVATEAVLRAITGHTARGEPLPLDLQGELIDPAEVARVAVELIQADGMAGRVIALHGGRPPRLLHGRAGR
ncbi:MAG TPA: SDR family oxidoreductase [Gaiellales bacterium]|jgi:NAD(P)-dependent dehydrogenase (short-subunit alcohol dehydrogenase family)